MNNYWDNHFFYFPKYNYGFYNINKNASQAITQSIYYEEINIIKLPEVKVFCIIRDIMDRFISIYHYSKLLVLQKRKEFLLCDIPKNVNKILVSPDKFLDHLLINGFWDNHQVPQIWFLNGKVISNFRRLNHVSLFLNFHKLNQEIKKIGKDIKLKKINIQKNKQNHSEFIKKRKWDILALYNDDIQLMEKAGVGK